MITDKQLDARNKGIGSSDVPAIFGACEWRSAKDVWLQKTGRLLPNMDTVGEAAEIGSAMEPVILKMAGERLGVRVVAPTSTFVKGVLRANVDGMIDAFVRGNTIVESKMTSRNDGWGDPGTNQVPERVMLQVQHQMLCAGSPLCWVAVINTAFAPKFNLYKVPFDIEMADTIEDVCTAWWANYVVSDQEPEGSQSSESLKYRRRVDGKSIKIDSRLLTQFDRAKKLKDEMTEAFEFVKSKLIASLGDAEQGVCDELSLVAKYTNVSTNRFDVARFKLDHPEMASLYTSNTDSRRLTVTKDKHDRSKQD